MIEYTLNDLAIGAVAILLAVRVLRPYTPSWAWYAFGVGFAVYFLVDALGHGPSRTNIGMMVLFSLGAFLTWWRELRGRPHAGCERGDQS